MTSQLIERRRPLAKSLVDILPESMFVYCVINSKFDFIPMDFKSSHRISRRGLSY